MIPYFNLRLSISSYIRLISSPRSFITLNHFIILLVHFGSTPYPLLHNLFFVLVLSPYLIIFSTYKFVYSYIDSSYSLSTTLAG